MKHCPDRHRLEQFLNGDTEGDDTREITRHIEECPQCQGTLETLTSLPELNEKTKIILGKERPDFLSEIIRAGSQQITPQEDPAYGADPTIPGYEVIGRLGQGGMGIVYHARHLKLNRLVALKLIYHAGDPDDQLRRRFRTECEAVAKVQHPNIVQIFDVGEYEGRPFVTLEWVDGKTLGEHTANEPQSPDWAAQTILTLARAVGHVHEQNIIHRDLKPNNVLLANDGTIKITDFGIAKRTDATMAETKSGEILGTPNFMAPEQAVEERGEITPRTDVYSLGAILYELLVGRPPFQAEGSVETIIQLLNEDPIPPSSFRKLPPDLEVICLKCLEKDARLRYESMSELADDLERYLDGLPIKAKPVSWARKSSKWIRRHPARTLVAALFAMLIIFAGVWLWSNEQSRQRWQGQVAAAIQSATANLEQGNWREANASLREINKLLEERSNQRWAEEDVNKIRHHAEIANDVQQAFQRSADTDVKRNRLNRNLEADLTKVLTKLGHSVGDDLETVAETVDQCPFAVQQLMIVALERWRNSTSKHPTKQWLTKVLQKADKNPWRTKMRSLSIKDPESISQFARNREIAELTPIDVRLLAGILQAAKLREEAIRVLTQGQEINPGDYWLNQRLAEALSDVETPDWNEVIRYYAIAVAIRPMSAGSHVNLGTAYFSSEDFVKAERQFRIATDLEPQYLIAWLNLGNALKSQDRFLESAAAYKQGLKINDQDVSGHLAYAVSLVNANQIDAAHAAVDKALQLSPDNPVAHARKALVFRFEEKYAEAIDATKKAVQLQPDVADWRFLLGVAHFDNQDFNAALTSYREALKIDNRHAKAQTNAGVCLWRLGKFEEAKIALERAIDLAPELVPPRNALAEVENILKSGRGYKKPDSPEVARLRKKAKELREAEKFDDLVATYREILELEPDHVLVLVDLAEATRRYKKDLTEANRLIKRALQLSKKDWKALTIMGDITWDLGNREAGLNYYRQAINANLRQLDPYLRLGSREHSLRRFGEAEHVFRQAALIAPNNAEVFYQWSRSLRGMKRLDDAVAKLEKAIELDPKHAMALYELGALYADFKKKPTDAISLFTRSIEAQPGYFAYHNRGLVRQRIGQDSSAQKDFQAALKINPRFSPSLYLLANSHLKGRNYVEAEKAFRQLIKISPESAEAHCNLGHTLLRDQRPKEALPFFQKGHKLGKKRPNWKYPSEQWIRLCETAIEALESSDQN